MKISCEIAEDLLPLYLEDTCSKDSRAALEEHLQGCPACRAKLERMGRPLPEVQGADAPRLADYGRKVRRRRRQTAVLVLVITVSAAFLLALTGLTVREMRRPVHVPTVEEGTWNLTAEDLETTAAAVDGYVLYTNYAQIQVTVCSEAGGAVLLRDAASGSMIQTAEVEGGTDSCTFTMLTSARRYIVDCGDIDGGAAVTVSEGRSFWRSLGEVLRDLVRL